MVGLDLWGTNSYLLGFVPVSQRPQCFKLQLPEVVIFWLFCPFLSGFPCIIPHFSVNVLCKLLALEILSQSLLLGEPKLKLSLSVSPSFSLRIWIADFNLLWGRGLPSVNLFHFQSSVNVNSDNVFRFSCCFYEGGIFFGGGAPYSIPNCYLL